MIHRVFVYGTLKEGFPNFHANHGVRVPGEFVTVHAYPLYVIGACHVPWLVDRAGEGHPVRGQVFEVDDAGLATMDELELVDQPGWYLRATIPVRRYPEDGGEPLRAFVYFGDAQRLREVAVHLGPIPEYRPDHAVRYRDGEL